MKKKLLILPVLAFLLGSCNLPFGPQNNQGDSGDPSDPTDPTDPVDPIPTEWSELVAESMRDHLYGEVLPFAYLTDEDYGYNVEDDYWYIDGKKGNSFTPKMYAKNYKAEDGWDGRDVSDSENGSEYAFTKKVTTDDGDRYIQVYFYAYNVSSSGSNVTTLGKYFFIAAYDPYVYEFPSDKAKEYASDVSGLENPILPPDYEADSYAVSDDYEVIYSKVESETDDYGYNAKLTALSWNILEERDEYGYYVAVAPDESYQVSYLYDEDYGAFYVYFEKYIKRYEGWPSASFVEEKFGFSFAIPAPETEEAYESEYYFIEAYEYLFWGLFPVSVPDGLYIEIKANLVDSYSAQLENAGWTLGEDNYGSLYAYDPDYKLNISFSYLEDEGLTYLEINRFEDIHGKIGYPSAEEIEEVLGVQGFSVPELDVGEAEVFVTCSIELDDDEAEYFSICVSGVNMAKEYGDQLEALGWTITETVDNNGDPYYCASNSETSILIDFCDYLGYEEDYEPATYIFVYIPVYSD